MFISTTSEILDNKENYKLLRIVHSQASRGMGLWTSICMAFANIFGTKCKHYSKKIELVKKEALNNIIAEAQRAGADGVVDIRFAISGLSVVVSGTAVELNNYKNSNPNVQKNNQADNFSEKVNGFAPKHHTATFNHDYHYSDETRAKFNVSKGTRVFVTKENPGHFYDVEFVDLEHGNTIKVADVPERFLSFE